jgi:histidinol-phosphatase
MPYERELEAAIRIAREAGDLTLKYFHSETATEEKPDASPVTIADRESERWITSRLESEFPDDGILGEEGSNRPSRSGRRWIIDPIDGTRDFVRRTLFWAIHVALEDQGRVVAGVIHLPCLGETCFAREGGGAFLNDAQIHASAISDLEKAVLMISGFKDAWTMWPGPAIRDLTEKCWTVRAYSGCYDVTLLARGKADVWLSGSGEPWDFAPARIIAQESGAVYLTRSGGSDIHSRHCLICAPALESELRKTLGIPPAGS